jgi:hypothetical protein
LRTVVVGRAVIFGSLWSSYMDRLLIAATMRGTGRFDCD